MSTPDPCPTGLMERFGVFITRLKQAVADGSGRNKALMGPLTLLLRAYLSRTLDRLSRLHAQFLAGTLPAPCPAGAAPRQSAEHQSAEQRSTGCAAPEARAASPRIPTGHVFVPFFVAHLYHALDELMADPEMLALLQAAPQAGRILRPLWRRMTAAPLPEILMLPKRPRRSRQTVPPAPEPEPQATTAAAPRKRSPGKLPRPRRQALPEEDRPVWVWHPPPLKSV